MITFPSDEEMRRRAEQAAADRNLEYRMYVRAAVSDLREQAERHRQRAKNRADTILAHCLREDALVIEAAADKIEKAAFPVGRSND